MSTASLLLLADGRFPSGGHAHSNGVEAACATGAIDDVASLGAYVEGRLATAGRVDASFAAAAAASPGDGPSPATRASPGDGSPVPG